ncbi:hypothetical protein C0J52_00338 [Blattella germanica]|nr:hypothetical protein C0J52_00338 [Blattella germanica]
MRCLAQYTNLVQYSHLECVAEALLSMTKELILLDQTEAVTDKATRLVYTGQGGALGVCLKHCLGQSGPS